MPGVVWSSSEEKAREWAYAKEKLTLDGKLLPDGTKLRRKDPDTDLRHSFMVMDDRIVVLSGEGVHLGTGEFGHAKLAEDLKGDLFALKVIKDDKSDDVVAQLAIDEAQIANDLGIAGQCVTRSTAEGTSKQLDLFID